MMNFSCKTKVVFTFLGVIFVLMGCGKKVKNTMPESTSNYTSTPALEIGSVGLMMQINDEEVIYEESYDFQQNAWIVIPTAEDIKLKSGSPDHYRTRIYFNSSLTPRFDGSSELFCEYSVVKVRGVKPADDYYKKTFKGCFEDVDYDGVPDPMSYSPGIEVVQDSGKQIRFVFEYGFSSEPAEIYTELQITDWF